MNSSFIEENIYYNITLRLIDHQSKDSNWLSLDDPSAD